MEAVESIHTSIREGKTMQDFAAFLEQAECRWVWE